MKLSPVIRRLLPLYICCLFDGLVFWYAIEKVFMVGIGFNAGTIAMFAVVLAVVGLALEIPSGILADRWSRKGVLMIASGCLAVASLLLGLSDSIVEYVLATCLYGVYFSFHSGTNEAMVYDALVEETGSRNGYEKYYGYTTILGGVGLAVGSLLGGVIASQFGLQAAYLLSVPGGIIAVLALLRFKEPKLHKAHELERILEHTRDTLRSVLKKGYTAWVLVALLASTVMFELMTEIDQLWPLALNLKLELYGPLNALVLAGFGLGGVVAACLLRKRYLLYGAYVLAFVVVCLLSVRNMAVIAFAQFGLVTLYAAFYTIAIGKLQDSLPSHLRNGSASVAGTLGGLVYIPVVLLFGFVASSYDVFSASYVLIPLALLSIGGTIIVLRHKGAIKIRPITEQVIPNKLST